MAHEIGHNYGSLHDDSTVPAGGVYLMYPYANAGGDTNNDKFSDKSLGEISATVKDRGGCFLETALPSCGNSIIEENSSYVELCDAGINGDQCCESTSTSDCVTQGLAFKSGAVCSPRSPSFGSCCFNNCTRKPENTVCGEETECRGSGSCNSTYHCEAGSAKENDLTCQVGVILGNGQTGDSVCDAGVCSKSICELIEVGGQALTACSTLTGEAACRIECMVGGTCTEIGDIPSFSNTVTFKKLDGTGSVVSDELQANTPAYKAAGAFCTYEASQPTSGICNANNLCEFANGESDALDELREQYAKYQRLFTDWANEETAGLKNYVWLVIGGVLLLIFCFTGCYFANRPAIQNFQKQRSVRKGRAGEGLASHQQVTGI